MDVKHNTYNLQEVGLAKALIRKGNVCNIVFWTNNEEVNEQILFDNEKKSITIFYRQSITILKNAIYKNLDHLISQYDVIQPCEYNQLQSWILAKKYPEKTVIYHGPYYSQFNKKYNLMCKFVDLFVLPTYKKKNTCFLVKSNLAKKFLIQKGIPAKNVTVSGVGIDLDVFSENISDNLPEEVIEIDKFNNCLKLLYIGRLEPRRNIPFLLDVLKNVNNKGIQAILIIVGNGDEEYTKRCFDLSEKLNINSKIHWIKKLEQKYLSFVYQRTNIFLLPTYYEIFGMVLLEAMFFGKPVITTLNGGSDILIKKDDDGIVLDKFAAEKWADVIVTLKDNTRIGSRAHQKIRDNFTWDSLCDAFISVYSSRIK